jgi:hypothetical protein
LVVGTLTIVLQLGNCVFSSELTIQRGAVVSASGFGQWLWHIVTVFQSTPVGFVLASAKHLRR